MKQFIKMNLSSTLTFNLCEREFLFRKIGGESERNAHNKYQDKERSGSLEHINSRYVCLDVFPPLPGRGCHSEKKRMDNVQNFPFFYGRFNIIIILSKRRKIILKYRLKR